MEYSLNLASIITLLVPLPLLVVFSLISLIRQIINERTQKEQSDASPINVLQEKRDAS